jgi:hypothetical protein
MVGRQKSTPLCSSYGQAAFMRLLWVSPALQMRRTMQSVIVRAIVVAVDLADGCASLFAARASFVCRSQRMKHSPIAISAISRN